jgi:SNF2 family DNA or RNA helicase
LWLCGGHRLAVFLSIEEKIRNLQRQKSALALDVLGGESFTQKLAVDDLKFLVAD